MRKKKEEKEDDNNSNSVDRKLEIVSREKVMCSAA